MNEKKILYKAGHGKKICCKPDSSDPYIRHQTKVEEKERPSLYMQHLSLIGEGCPALGIYLAKVWFSERLGVILEQNMLPEMPLANGGFISQIIYINH